MHPSEGHQLFGIQDDRREDLDQNEDVSFKEEAKQDESLQLPEYNRESKHYSKPRMRICFDPEQVFTP